MRSQGSHSDRRLALDAASFTRYPPIHERHEERSGDPDGHQGLLELRGVGTRGNGREQRARAGPASGSGPRPPTAANRSPVNGLGLGQRPINHFPTKKSVPFRLGFLFGLPHPTSVIPTMRASHPTSVIPTMRASASVWRDPFRQLRRPEPAPGTAHLSATHGRSGANDERIRSTPLSAPWRPRRIWSERAACRRSTEHDSERY